MSPKHSKYCIIILSFCLAVSLGGNLYSLAYPLIQSRAENAKIGWIPAEYASDVEVIYPEVIPVDTVTVTKEEEAVDSAQIQEQDSIDAMAAEEKPILSEEPGTTEIFPQTTVKPTPTKKPAATQQPSIRYNGATVYVTKTGTKFHRETCSSLSKSKIAISFEEACAKMYEPCGKCNP